MQFEFGPLSEASIGNVGLRPGTTGWVDHIVTPAGALEFMVAEDAVDRCVITLVESWTANRLARERANDLQPEPGLVQYRAGTGLLAPSGTPLALNLHLSVRRSRRRDSHGRLMVLSTHSTDIADGLRSTRC